MSAIRPFRGVVYNTKKINNMADVICPPYDIIPPKMQQELYRKHPNNFVRLELGKIGKKDTERSNRYTRAKSDFEGWLRRQIMTRDEKEAIYVYVQEYKEGTKKIERVGFIALMKLDLGKRRILAHENTLAAPKADRIKMVRMVKANLSPVFVLYDDSRHIAVSTMRRECGRRKPFIDITFDGVRHKIWRLEDRTAIDTIDKSVSARKIFIADGHHRYEVSCTYAREITSSGESAKPKDLARYMMAYFVESDERMLTVLPTHRMIKDVGPAGEAEIVAKASKAFHIEKMNSLPSLMRKLGQHKQGCSFGMYLGGRVYYLLRLIHRRSSDDIIKDKPKAWKRLDVSILHRYLLEHLLGIKDDEDNIEYAKDAENARDAVREKRFKAAFFLNPTKVSQIKEVARIGERMPRKATYFYPKPVSGLIVNQLT